MVSFFINIYCTFQENTSKLDIMSLIHDDHYFDLLVSVQLCFLWYILEQLECQYNLPCVKICDECQLVTFLLSPFLILILNT